MEPFGVTVRRSGVLRGFRVGLVALAGVATTLLAPPATAQQGGPAQTGGTQLTVEAGFAGRYRGGGALPIRITIQTDRLVRGSLQLEVDGTLAPVSIPVEVPGGSSKQLVVVLPTPQLSDVGRVRATLSGAGDPVRTNAEVRVLRDEELVGLLPDVTPANLPDAQPLPMGGGTARFATLDEQVLLASPASLDPLGTIVAGPDELGRLDAASRAGILDWIDRGGRLVVDATPGTPIAGLPDPWQPGAGSRIPAGLGEVRFSAGAAAAGRWADLLEPTPNIATSELQQFSSFFFPNEPLGDSIARDAGLQSLDLPWLVAFLGIYTLLAGPVTWFVLRKRRPDLGWIVIPALAVLFTAGGFVAGSDLRSSTRAAHGSILETGDGGSRLTTVLGTVSRTGGDGRARFPAGWLASAVDNSFFGGPTGASVSVVQGATGPEARISLAAGEFGAMTASGPVPVTAGLRVTAVADGDRITGTVTNDSEFRVEQVGVFVGRGGTNIGALEPGESGDFAITVTRRGGADPFAPTELQVWPDVVGYDRPPRFDSVVNLALWSDAQISMGANAHPTGVAVAVGWTRSFSPPVDVLGQGAPEGRSAIIGRSAVAAGPGGQLAPGSVRRELVRGPQGVDSPQNLVFPTEGSLYRFTLPAGATVDGLELDVPAYLAGIEGWDGQSFRVLDVSENNNLGDPFQTRRITVPADVVRDGVLWVLGTMRTDFGIFDGTGLELHSPVDATATLDDGGAADKPGKDGVR